MKSMEQWEDGNDAIEIDAYNNKVIKYPADITMAESRSDIKYDGNNKNWF